MLMAATLSRSGRAAPRIPAARPATLRDPRRQPVDIFIENLSEVGFGMSTTADLPVGSFASLQLAGVGQRDVRIVRRLGLSYGCQFVPALSVSELTLALDAGEVLDGRFARETVRALQPAPAFRVHPLGRAAVLCMLNVALWGTIIAGFRTIMA